MGPSSRTVQRGPTATVLHTWVGPVLEQSGDDRVDAALGDPGAKGSDP